ncbi:putative sigma-54 modulation protein [Luteibacter sp. Sphag1AF]|uniref:ribosome hibernation-promoting factor, HPF/YfiA family n=1 Tax=Luteibacter sp. Sphag1AF TaxID=2587031 RepID=UPI00161CE3B2|nr:ribosome-associated translation inhibitor RaiA [Luteibacter sp. Sphag1AF]MBB3225672.1 putative sigma-54 modulation protein [Luteibacter sp. Sphag1AF]
MQVQLSGQHIEITPALRERVESHTSRFQRLFENITTLSVVLSVDAEKRAEGSLLCTGKKLHAEATNPDMYAAIDDMMTKLSEQLRKHKEKLTDHHNQEVRNARAAV